MIDCLRSKVDKYPPWMIFVPMHIHATFQNLSCSHPFAPGKTPRSQVLVKHSLRVEIWFTSSSNSINCPLVVRRKSPCLVNPYIAPWWKGVRAPAFKSQVPHKEPTKCFRLNWLSMTVILSRVERFKTQIIMPLYLAPRRNVNTPIPGKKLTERRYRVKKMTIVCNYFTEKIWFGRIHLSLRDPNLVSSFLIT